MRRFFLCSSFVALLFSSCLSASEFKVVTTVKPLNLIVQELTAGAAESETLLPVGSSPHDYALRPSDVKKLRDADLVIWVGPELEMFLTKVLAESKNSLALTEQHSIAFRHYEDGVEINHSDHNHSHDGIDPHLWLGPKQAIQAANVISERLIQLDPLHKNRYEDNLLQFVSGVEKAIKDLNKDLTPLAERGYYVFHDGYGYFEEQFGLNNLGHFTVDPDRRPGAKTLVTIRRALQEKQAQCVFSEPQFSPAVVKSVVSGTEVNIGTLDPMATEIAEDKGGYVRFLHELGQSFTNCLK
ncbi:zinc ABC transporter substrate-binding protein ZnuA [Photobacterium sp. SDRW27]|uniref:zinc ABC transporter substrate-binding protein ZnuA n=1 Tax=Photobacterium obscurum TaxID=2829490 RepID=UPI002244853D|nr:zinc ABC transporter substrate-binding protein ZnuA [Photobacterium obscurum]MCW8327553.1 zinc ABC transporter substrate-binding protein ZnuA [Photobacterium obscurum]